MNRGSGLKADRLASLRSLADALERVLRGSAADADSIIGDLPKDLHTDALDVLANVTHFLADSDIRHRDERYRDKQERDMVALISDLRRGAPLEELMKHTFL